MSNDFFRTKFEFEFELICAVCGKPLTFFKKKVSPCSNCIDKAKEPLNHLKKALSLLEEGLKDG